MARTAQFEVYKDQKGEFRWRMRATNGEQIADSNEGYKDKDDCLRGIELLRRDAPGATIEDKT